MPFKKAYRKTFGHKSPYRRVFGSRTPRQAAEVTVKQYSKVLKEINDIQSRLNVEKKHKDVDVVTSTVGQANQDSDGYTLVDVTPVISQGTHGDARVGNSLKLTGMTLPMSFAQQEKCLGDRKIRCTLLKVMAADNGVSGDEAVQNVWDTNPLTGLRDFNCPRAYRSRKTDGISIIRSQVILVKGPQFPYKTEDRLTNREMQVKNFRMSVKRNDILRFDSNGDTTPDGVKYYLVFQCNAGNRSGTASGLDIPITDDSTGVQLRVSQRNWWVDN